MPYNVIALERCRRELQKTSVISKEFKQVIGSLMFEAYYEGVDDGKQEEKGETTEKKLKRKEAGLKAL